MKPSKITLSVVHELRASHSLPGFETPHFHLWKIQVKYQAALPLKKDKVVDMVELESVIAKICAPLEGTYLNDTQAFSPTCEELAQWLWEKLAEKIDVANLRAVRLTLCNLSGIEMGYAEVER